MNNDEVATDNKVDFIEVCHAYHHQTLCFLKYTSSQLMGSHQDREKDSVTPSTTMDSITTDKVIQPTCLDRT